MFRVAIQDDPKVAVNDFSLLHAFQIRSDKRVVLKRVYSADKESEETRLRAPVETPRSRKSRSHTRQLSVPTIKVNALFAEFLFISYIRCETTNDQS